MDTKSKNTKKYPLIVKALCLVLAVVCFLGTGACAVYGVLAARFLPGTGNLTPVSFYDTEMFSDMVCADLASISEVLYEPQRTAQLEAYRTQRDAILDREVQRYSAEKAAIIRAEIYYVATHYDEIDGDYYYDAYMRDFSTTTTTAAVSEPTVPHTQAASGEDVTETTVPPETAEEEADPDLSALPTVQVDERAPYNVRYCQSLCNTVTGLDWLQYESLVRDEAFRENEFRPSFGDLGHYNNYSFIYSEQQIRAQFAEEYDDILQNRKAADTQYARNRLNKLRNLKFLAIPEDGTVFTNMEKTERNSKNILSHSRSILCKDGKVTVQMQDADRHVVTLENVVKDQIEPTGGTLYVYFEDPFLPGDRYASVKDLFDKVFVKLSIQTVILVGIAFAVGAVFFFVTLLCLCGHKSGVEGITLAFIDRVPTDIHLFVSGVLILGLLYFFVRFGDSVYDNLWHAGSADDTGAFAFSFGVSLLGGFAFAGALYLAAIEWLTSTVRIKKAGESYFRKFVLWKLVRLVFRGIAFCWWKITAGFRFLFDKPKKLRYLPFLALAGWIAAALFLGLVSAVLDSIAPIIVFLPLTTVVFALAAVWFLRMLDRIADAAETRTDLPQDVTRKMPRVLRNLAENLSVTNRELDKAVADAVRNERTKAELITNVSHDLKTPLTSVISYVDLLKKCDVKDEKALEYIGVLDEKSAKLKRLVEDLIEASKVNTGNVKLERVPLNLSELTAQAVTEVASDFEENGLELKYNPPESAPVVFADGAKTYRILDNLLSNARKYSAPGSRVYVKVTEDEQYGIFEIKNVSREPLDVDPQELMERFVRGDRSRTQDGNGLGLSIAQQLCLLQGGRLEIGIDGDLFKASVVLPKTRTAEGNVTQA